MSTLLPSNLYSQNAGTTSNLVSIPVIQTRAPVSTDSNPAKYPIGRPWIDRTNNAVYVITNNTASSGSMSATWVGIGGGAVELSTLTDTAGTTITPSAGNIQISGTANQITATAGSSLLTLALPSAITAPGSLTTTTSLSATTTVTAGTGLTVTTGGAAITGTTTINNSGSAVTTIGTGGTGAVNIGNATGNTSVTGSLTASTTLTATLGNITATNGNLSLATAGNKIVIATGSNASVGTSGVMSGTPGVVTVATTACSATAKVFYCRNVTGGTPGQVSITAQDGTGFTLTSTGNETSSFNWWIVGL